MKTTIKALAAATVLAGAALSMTAANAATLILDVTDVDSNDGLGDPDNVWGFFDIGAGSTVDYLAYDLYMYADSPSWLSEMTIYFGPSDQSTGVFLTPGYLDDTSGLGYYTGAANLTDLGLAFNVGADGLLYIEFFETYDDYPDDWDGYYITGTLTVGYTPVASPAVPEPATWAMMIGGLGLAGAFLRRGRRTAQVSFS